VDRPLLSVADLLNPRAHTLELRVQTLGFAARTVDLGADALKLIVGYCRVNQCHIPRSESRQPSVDHSLKVVARSLRLGGEILRVSALALLSHGELLTPKSEL
jgi:hypothetical protein